MDLGVGTPPEVNSTHHDEEHPLHSPNSVRKRKLELEQLALPTSKRKFRHQLVPGESSEGSMDESETPPEFHEGPEQIEGGSSSRGSSNTMEDLECQGAMSPKIFVPHFEPLESSSNPQDSASKDSLYSLDSRIVENNKDLDCRLPVPDADHGVGEPDCQLPVPGVDEGDEEFMEEEFPDETAEEWMQSCCDDVGPHTLGLSSARWNIKQDALPGTGRPTIDQEFEQYFSMFML